MHLVRPALCLMLLASLAAPAQAQRGDPIPKLEAARAKSPRSVGALRALGIAYYNAKRYADARASLELARTIDPKDGISALYAGLSAEGAGDLTAARNAYNSYLAVGKTKKVRNDIRARLVALSRAEMVNAAKAAVANEGQISQIAGSPRTIAVPPLRFSGTDTTLIPLERGMAELLITDLSRSSQLTVVERDRMQALADEIKLSQSDRVDAATAVRAGRLIQAGRIVNGAIVQSGNRELTLDATIVNVSTSQSGAPSQVRDDLDALFDMEKRLVFQLFDALEIRLTPAERELVEQRPTRNLNAFLSYSRGLMAADDGRFDDAARYFENARSLDPGFGAATARFNAAQQAQLGAQVSASTVESDIKKSAEGQVVTSAERGVVSTTTTAITTTLANAVSDVNPSAATTVASTTSTTSSATPQRDATTSTTATDAPAARTGTVTIVIRRP